MFIVMVAGTSTGGGALGTGGTVLRVGALHALRVVAWRGGSGVRSALGRVVIEGLVKSPTLTQKIR
jgi:hypothetical protein